MYIQPYHNISQYTLNIWFVFWLHVPTFFKWKPVKSPNWGDSKGSCNKQTKMFNYLQILGKIFVWCVVREIKSVVSGTWLIVPRISLVIGYHTQPVGQTRWHCYTIYSSSPAVHTSHDWGMFNTTGGWLDPSGSSSTSDTNIVMLLDEQTLICGCASGLL